MFQFCRQTEQIAEQMTARPPKLWGVLPRCSSEQRSADYSKCDLRIGILRCNIAVAKWLVLLSVEVASLVNCDWNGKMSLTA
jgi:hypothetical protein